MRGPLKGLSASRACRIQRRIAIPAWAVPEIREPDTLEQVVQAADERVPETLGRSQWPGSQASWRHEPITTPVCPARIGSNSAVISEVSSLESPSRNRATSASASAAILVRQPTP